MSRNSQILIFIFNVPQIEYNILLLIMELNTTRAGSLLFLALASEAGNFNKLLAQTSFYLPNKIITMISLTLVKKYLPVGLVHLKLYLPGPAMKMNMLMSSPAYNTTQQLTKHILCSKSDFIGVYSFRESWSLIVGLSQWRLLFAGI